MATRQPDQRRLQRVDAVAARDDAQLRSLGIKPELKRSLGFLSNFAIAFAFILWMKERPLRSSSRQAAEAVIAD